MINETQNDLEQLVRRIEALESIIGTNSYNLSNIEFKKNVSFRGAVTLGGPITLTGDSSFANILKITKTAGTAPIADGTVTKTIPSGGGSITIVTKNGIITAIS